MKKITLITLLLAATSFAVTNLPPNYDSLTATEKRDLQWQQIITSPYSTSDSPTLEPGKKSLCPLNYGFSILKGVLIPKWDVPRFTHESDEMPDEDRGHTKALHSYGTANKIRWIAKKNTSGYTGIFAKGGIGVMRASLAAPYDGDSYKPGMALKFYIDGKPSVNFHTMFSLEGQGTDFNYFTNTFTNTIPPPEEFALKAVEATAFKVATQYMMDNGPVTPHELPLDETAAAYGDVDWKAPYQVVFTPTTYAHSLINLADSETDIRKQFGKLKFDPKQAIFTISARDQDGEFTQIGELYVETPEFVASEYGDQILFFKHQRQLPR